MNPSLNLIDEKSANMATAWGPNWGSYLYQNFLLSSGSGNVPTPTTLDWLDAAAQPPIQQLNVSSSVGMQPQDYFGLPASAANQPEWSTNTNTNTADNSAPAVMNIKTEVVDNDRNDLQLQLQYNQQQQQHQQQQQQRQQQPQAGPSSFYPQFNYFSQSGGNTGINTALLTQQQQKQNDYSPQSFSAIPLSAISRSTDSVHMVDNSLTRSPSPISSLVVSPHESPLPLPIRHRPRNPKGRPKGGKKRSHSNSALLSDSEGSASHSHDDHDHDHDEHEHEPEVPEGVERDGMIWGMKVEDYRALSARERKRVRNRISARTFRAKRKEHLTSLEHDLGEKDLQIKLANDESARLRKEVAELKRKLAKYEKQY